MERLIRIAASHPEWVLGYADEVWWSRLQQPRLHTWTEGEPLHLHELVACKDESEPKAIACYGLLRTDLEQLWLRFVEGRPVSQVTQAFLEWSCERLHTESKQALLLIWDNATWHKSQQVRKWIKQHNRQVKQSGGVRVIGFRLPVKSPWLNRIEAHWVHGKRAIVEPTRKLSVAELIERVCTYFGCEQLPHLSQEVS